MTLKDFRNEPPLDFSLAEERSRFAETLQELRQTVKSGGLRASPILNGTEKETSHLVDSTNPSEASEIVGRVHFASPPLVEEAIETARRGSSRWSKLGFQRRATILRNAAEVMRKERLSLAALMVLEAGKPWGEADADVCEAIDFCEYYALLGETMGPEHLMPYLHGEVNHYTHAPRGISTVISPWNFPLAIATGMTVASLVAGNPTILKPAEQTSLIAHRLATILLEAGVSSDAFAFLPGQGELIGKALVEHPAVKLICFTGSRAVGLEILQSTARLAAEQGHIKKIILELGGKNAIIVDEDADFDEAIKGVLYSAFGFAGQKCSACSRVIVLKSAYSKFVERLVEAAADLIVAPAEQPETFVGPLIDRESQERVKRLVDEAERTLTKAFSGACPESGFFVPVTIFSDVPEDSLLWKEEAFAPVLCVREAESFDHALQLANTSDYALTGGVFSRNPSHLAKAREEFEVGNLYLNRSITGAIVGRQPFGGFRLSGVGSKAGGPDYLHQFVEPRSVSENTMRKGFTPELAN